MTTKAPRRVLTVTVAAMALMVLLAGCSHSTGTSSFAGGVQASPGATTTVTDSTSTSAALSLSSLVLSDNGLGPVTFGTEAARALAELTQALGQAEKPTPIPAGSACGATRMFQWRNLHVLVDEAIAAPGATAGFVGWSLSGGDANALGLKTDTGIGIGSPLGVLRSTYGEHFSVVQSDPTPVFKITTPDGIISGELDGLAADDTVRALRAGTFCGE